MQTSWADYSEYSGPGLGEAPDSSDVDSDMGPTVNEAEVLTEQRRRRGSPGRECFDADGNVIRLQNLRLSDAFNDQPGQWIRPARSFALGRASSRGGRRPSVSAGRIPSDNRYEVLVQPSSPVAGIQSLPASPVATAEPSVEVSGAESLPDLVQDSSDSVSSDGSGW